MSYILKNQGTIWGGRSYAAPFLLMGALVLVMAGPGQPLARADAVDDLKLALALPAGLDQGVPSQDFLDYRRATLQKSIDKLHGIGELRRALSLDEWKEAPNSALNKQAFKIADIDFAMRKQVGERFAAKIREVIEKGGATSRLAAANSITEIGPTIRSTMEGDRMGFAHSLTPEVIQLARDRDLGVRQEALRALGNIFPNPKEAVPVFQEVLEKDAVGPKRLAALGLSQLIKNASYLKNTKAAGTGVDALRSDVLEAIVAVVGANRAGLNDADLQVRAQCLRNIQEAAGALADLTPDGFSRKAFPMEGRKLLPEEMKLINDSHEFINQKIKELTPAMDALRAQGPALAASLEGPDASVRLAALDALESIGYARIRLKKLINSVPFVTTAEKIDDGGNRDLMKGNDTLEEFISKHLGSVTKLLRDRDVNLRRRAVEFLEIIEDDAVPALPLLAESLRDSDRFVRGSAARAIGNIAPEKAALAVPALAELLRDPDLEVRKTTAKTLTEMGQVAQAAVPALALAVNNGDVEGRLLALEALRSIGPEKGKSAVPSLIQALSTPDPRVKRQAAKLLGTYGADALAALPALRHCIGDDDQEVRQNAAEAILEIEPLR